MRFGVALLLLSASFAFGQGAAVKKPAAKPDMNLSEAFSKAAVRAVIAIQSNGPKQHEHMDDARAKASKPAELAAWTQILVFQSKSGLARMQLRNLETEHETELIKAGKPSGPWNVAEELDKDPKAQIIQSDIAKCGVALEQAMRSRKLVPNVCGN